MKRVIIVRGFDDQELEKHARRFLAQDGEYELLSRPVEVVGLAGSGPLMMVLERCQQPEARS